jgi:hypothetical protein
VQDIQRYVDLAASLDVMADSVQGQGGSSLLALRAQVLQYARTNAWGWMMDDPMDLPLAMTPASRATANSHARAHWAQ